MDLIKKLRETGLPLITEDGTIVDMAGINFSMADMYTRCGEQVRRRYVLGEKEPPAIALIEGTSHHKSMEEDNLSKKKTGKQLSAAKLTEIFQTKLDQEVSYAEKQASELHTSLDWEGEDRDALLSRAKKLHEQYAFKYSKKLEPVLIEEPFSKDTEVDGIKFNIYGQTDLTTPTTLVDYKTSSREKSEKDVGKNLQLSVYSWARELQKAAFVVLVKSGDPHIQLIETERTPGQIQWALRVMARAVDGIRKGSFPLVNPGQFPPPWWCSPKFCGFWGKCRGLYESGE